MTVNCQPIYNAFMVTSTSKNIIEYLETHKKATAKELAEFLGISRQALHRQLLKLINNGKLAKYGRPPKVLYQAKENSLTQYSEPRVLELNTDKIKEVLNRVLPKYPAAFAYIFGSTATGHRHKDSDVDVAIGFSEPVGDNVFYKIFNEICGKLAIPSEQLDLKNFSELPLPVRFRVIRDGKLLYLKDPKTHRDMAVKTLEYYHDEEPFFRYAAGEFFKKFAVI